MSKGPEAIGYRIVHGGPHLREHCRITPKVLDTLRSAVHFAPLHIPPALALIDTASKLYPQAPAFACFDTAFHTTMPPEAFTYAIPARFRDEGVQRYGFHGLSYESIVAALTPTVPARLVVAHLGNGASLCAIDNGRSVDTSMGLTPTGGIPMGTRSGDLDPGVVLFIARTRHLNPNDLESLLNHESGLAGLSDPVARHPVGRTSPASPTFASSPPPQIRAPPIRHQAIAIFCRSIAKTAASYAAVLGGLDCLVFTGGIGEHSALVRERVSRQLSFLGIALDAEPISATPRSSPAARSIASRFCLPTKTAALPTTCGTLLAHAIESPFGIWRTSHYHRVAIARKPAGSPTANGYTENRAR